MLPLQVSNICGCFETGNSVTLSVSSKKILHRLSKCFVARNKVHATAQRCRHRNS